MRRTVDQRTVERFKPLRTNAAWEGPPKGKQTSAVALTAASSHAGLSTHTEHPNWSEPETLLEPTSGAMLSQWATLSLLGIPFGHTVC